MKETQLTEKQIAELAEMLEIAKMTERQARELNEEAIAFEDKWKCRLEGKTVVTPQASQPS